MDIGDEAQMRAAQFNRMAMENKSFDLPPMAPIKQDSEGNPLCVRCEALITKRRKVMPSAQRCIECQEDFDKRKRR